MTGQPEALAPVSEFEARRLTSEITKALTVAWDVVAEAYARRVWEPLGYGSWDVYCRAEFTSTHIRLPAEERQEVVESLREAGMSTRAIASATGTSEGTVRNDLRAGAQGYAPDDRSVTGLDGKRYPLPPATPAAEDDGVIDAEVVEKNTTVGETPTRRRRRRPLSDQVKDAGWDVRKAIERIDRLAADDRYPRQADQMVLLLRGHLIYVTETAHRLLDRMPEEGDPDEYRHHHDEPGAAPAP